MAANLLASACSNCPLRGRKRVGPIGDPATCKYVLIGEAPGATEAHQGLPFVGKSGRLLDKLLGASGIQREDCYITNAVKCWPPDNKLPKGAIEACRHHLLAELKEVPPTKPICCMGKGARDALFPGERKGVLATRGWRDFYDRDVLCTVHPAFCMYNPANAPILLKDFKRLRHGPRPPIEVKYLIIDTYDLMLALVREVAKREGEFVAFDLECTQIDYQRDEVLCIGIGYAPGLAAIITYYDVDLLQELFDLPVRWVGHNAKFDMRFLAQMGVRVPLDFDTIIAHYALDERRGTHALKPLADEYFDTGDYEAEVLKYVGKASGDYGEVPEDILFKYNAMDVEVTRRLAYVFEEELREQGLYEHPFRFPLMAAVPLLHAMEMRGIAIDWDALRRADTDVIQPELEKVARTLRTLSGHPDLNPRSSDQINDILYDEMGMPIVAIRTRSKGKKMKARSSKVEVVDHWLAHKLCPSPEVETFVTAVKYYRHVSKMQRSYVRKWESLRGTDDRVHPTFLLRGTVTGRLAVRDPPVQTIPSDPDDKWGRLISDVHIAAPGWRLVYADYGQMELRVAACLSQDEAMLESFNRQSPDYHTDVARAAFGENFTKYQRDFCKRLTFGWLFGGNAYEIARDGLQFSDKVAHQFADEWSDKFKGMATWRKKQARLMRSQGYVESLLGRRRRYALLTADNVGEAQRVAMNMPIQSIASDMTLISAMRMHEKCRGRGAAYVVLLIHDALVMEVREDAAEAVAAEMGKVMVATAEEYFPDVPFEADVKIIDRLGEA